MISSGLRRHASNSAIRFTNVSAVAIAEIASASGTVASGPIS